MPKNIPIKKIAPIESPSVQDSLTIISTMEEDIEASKAEQGEQGAQGSVASIQTTPTGEINIIMPPNPAIDRNMFDVIDDIFVQSDAIVFGKRVEVDLDIEVSRNEQRYGIEIQVNNLLDELLSKTPTHMRTPSVLDRVNRIVSRFKELREEYSIFDDYGNVLTSKNYNATHKPLVEQMNKQCGVRWIIPVSNQQLKLFDIPDTDSVPSNRLMDDLETYVNAETMVDADNRYFAFHNRINSIFTPFDKGGPNARSSVGPNAGSSAQVGADIEAIITSLDDYSATVYKKYKGTAKLAKQRFVIQRYNN
jgi:hypothetical protein